MQWGKFYSTHERSVETLLAHCVHAEHDLREFFLINLKANAFEMLQSIVSFHLKRTRNTKGSAIVGFINLHIS